MVGVQFHVNHWYTGMHIHTGMWRDLGGRIDDAQECILYCILGSRASIASF